jgi:MoaA/NifB/PqqE/SkfB family radical SAM enzyme
MGCPIDIERGGMLEVKHMTSASPWQKPPSTVCVEIMTICNLRCSHCYLYHSDRKKKIMDMDLFKAISQKISPILSGASEFNFASVEALMNPHVFDMIENIRNYNRRIHIPIFSNGMALNDQLISQIIEHEIKTVVFSLDGCRKETVESFKTGSDFNKIVGNISRLRKAAGRNVGITANFVAQKNNISEIKDYVEFCRDLGINNITVTGFISYPAEMSGLSLYSFSGNPAVEEILIAAQQKAKEYGVGFSYSTTKLKSKDHFCRLTTSILYIDSQGNIVPCSVLANRTRISLGGESNVTDKIIWGNVVKDDPGAVWNHSGYEWFRQMFHMGILPTSCRLCAMAYGVIC